MDQINELLAQIESSPRPDRVGEHWREDPLVQAMITDDLFQRLALIQSMDARERAAGITVSDESRQLIRRDEVRTRTNSGRFVEH